MRMRLLTVSQRQPQWVAAGTAEYVRRLPREWGFEVVEVKPVQRAASAARERTLATEAERLLAAVPKGARRIALDERGESWSTDDVSRNLAEWLQTGRDLAFLVGGADGLDPDLREQADYRWSLSPATFPHGLVRILVVEQLYRAGTLLAGHPYHRR